MYHICEVDGVHLADDINAFNARDPLWPPLTEQHLSDGYWWLAYPQDAFFSFSPEPIAFAGMIQMLPFEGYGYLKRCFVLPDYHGHGLQYRLMMARELKAKRLGWTHLVSECLTGNSFSAANFRKAGFDLCEPEQPWASGALYWIKRL